MNLGIYQCKYCKGFVMPNMLGRLVTCFCFEDNENTTGFYIKPSYFNDQGELISWHGGNTNNIVVIKQATIKPDKETLQ